MGVQFLVDLNLWLQDAGLNVVCFDGWQTRARSSGGFDPGRPVCVMWHHTASTASPEDDAWYCCYGSPDAPICNLLIARNGDVWLLAAGATNTNGKGGPVTVPPGSAVPVDSMNTHAVGIEICNNGIGEPYPAAQLDAAFTASLAVTAMCGLPPDAVCTHAAWTFYSRKIDPATADACLGPWRPGAVGSAGTWNLDDLRAECVRRATGSSPSPLPPLEDDVPRQLVRNGNPDDTAYNVWVVFDGGKFWLPSNEAIGIQRDAFGYDPLPVAADWMRATGPVMGDNPTDNAWGVWSG